MFQVSVIKGVDLPIIDGMGVDHNVQTFRLGLVTDAQVGNTDGAGVFSHFSAIADSGYRSLDENQKVEFEVTQGQKGPQ